MSATDDPSAGTAPGNPAATAPVRGNATISVGEDGALVIITTAVYLSADDAADVVLRLFGAIQRLKGAKP